MSKHEKQVPSNVVPMPASKCTAEDCKKTPKKAGFCDDHFAWFKEGLITKDGHKAKDFDKKYYNYIKRKAA